MINYGRILHASDDQFNALDSADIDYAGLSRGFNFVLTRKKPGGTSTEYQYKIGENASLVVGVKEYINQLNPPAGQWNDISYLGKDLYLYLTFNLYKNSEQIGDYGLAAPRLIIVNSLASLPKNFSGSFQKKPGAYDCNYYESKLLRKLIAILPISQKPIMCCNSAIITPRVRVRAGVARYEIVMG